MFRVALGRSPDGGLSRPWDHVLHGRPSLQGAGSADRSRIPSGRSRPKLGESHWPWRPSQWQTIDGVFSMSQIEISVVSIRIIWLFSSMDKPIDAQRKEKNLAVGWKESPFHPVNVVGFLGKDWRLFHGCSADVPWIFASFLSVFPSSFPLNQSPFHLDFGW